MVRRKRARSPTRYLAICLQRNEPTRSRTRRRSTHLLEPRPFWSGTRARACTTLAWCLAPWSRQWFGGARGGLVGTTRYSAELLPRGRFSPGSACRSNTNSGSCRPAWNGAGGATATEDHKANYATCGPRSAPRKAAPPWRWRRPPPGTLECRSRLVLVAGVSGGGVGAQQHGMRSTPSTRRFLFAREIAPALLLLPCTTPSFCPSEEVLLLLLSTAWRRGPRWSSRSGRT
jgi:hypothetical protein